VLVFANLIDFICLFNAGKNKTTKRVSQELSAIVIHKL